MYLTQGLRRAAQIRPREESTVFGQRRRIWSETADRVARIAGGLKEIGVRPGDRVAILALNSDRYFELLYAIPWLGAVMVPVNTRLATPEIRYILEDSGVRVLFADGAMQAHAADLAGQTPTLETTFYLDDDAAPAGVRHYEELAAGPALADAGAGGDTLAGIFYTGGTTGKSKGVMLSHNNLVWNAMNVIAGMYYDQDMTYIHSGPMFHLADGGATFGVTVCGGRHVFVPRFDATECLRTMESERVTHAALVPTMINMLVNNPAVGDVDLSRLDYITYGASPMPEGLLRKALESFPNCSFIHAYGMTEASPGVTLLPPRYATLDGPYAGRLKSCGQAQLTTELKIVDEERKILPRLVIGEVAVRGPMIMLGYWNMPEQTAAVLEAGWFYTGDAGYLDDEGFLFIVDRLKDMIISGGENVYSAEVENAISLMPGVAEVAVIGIPDPRWGETVHAVVVPRPGAGLTAEAVIEHCGGRIAGYKCPRSVEFRDTPLPQSGPGKILKRELREPFWTSPTR
ncbi:long-chain-fatty-acid--CoA ligase [Mycolicibacterium neworleansense]|uniref:Long-chain-fatty-acid--CoA ligase FadD13 n=1 Tax=Mycolicibacterium neworleansense TaxID=146018 RepID=A0A0H5RLY8_9MYCO|nr:long-chain-fatty-acid--CoA ligase [Mycolicibacterium neworleansense]MCV7364374.1 long-chain-fatty-acid--CoA ligase [Mycolicibacterium neworleansense]CRZ15160.1 feruloyl-CoA synthetase [Mycolicibacterium neworleansense]